MLFRISLMKFLTDLFAFFSSSAWRTLCSSSKCICPWLRLDSSRKSAWCWCRTLMTWKVSAKEAFKSRWILILTKDSPFLKALETFQHFSKEATSYSKPQKFNKNLLLLKRAYNCLFSQTVHLSLEIMILGSLKFMKVSTRIGLISPRSTWKT